MERVTNTMQCGLEEDGAMYTTERVNSVWRG
jgi:hypothetical protein